MIIAAFKKLYLVLIKVARMEQGWDPEVKRYFRKIISSLSIGLLWLICGVTAGLYFGLAYRTDISIVFVILFYAGLSGSLFLMLKYFYKLWKK